MDDYEMVRAFFFWCTVFNGGLLILWTAVSLTMPDLVYRTQKCWFPLSREAFGAVMYGFLGLYKIFFLVFNLIPLLALLVIG